uniref:Uncharacterized protein n=1 Tax=Ditylenchus dipsaci TaxID=166011 RepID=A0A915E6Y2_9BILA
MVAETAAVPDAIPRTENDEVRERLALTQQRALIAKSSQKDGTPSTEDNAVQNAPVIEQQYAQMDLMPSKQLSKLFFAIGDEYGVRSRTLFAYDRTSPIPPRLHLPSEPEHHESFYHPHPMPLTSWLNRGSWTSCKCWRNRCRLTTRGSSLASSSWISSMGGRNSSCARLDPKK